VSSETIDSPYPSSAVHAVQRRTLFLLFATQIIGGVGIAIGVSVGALLAAELAGTSLSGLAQSAVVVGSAILALPATAIVHRRGRRPSLATAYLTAASGAVIVVAAVLNNSIALLFLGFFLFGAGSTASLQARYAAVDLAPPSLRGRQLSTIVWATTIGAVAGPNLAAVAGASLASRGIPTLAGPFVFSAMLFGLAALLLLLLMRPDPAVLAGETLRAANSGNAPKRVGLWEARRIVAANASARLGVIGMAVGHTVMVAVMAMTPIHIRGAGHDAAHTLRIVGVVLSVHVAGMYAFSPIVGWLTDRLGRRPVILMGVVFLLAACALAATAGHNDTRLAIALMLLGLGWSCTMVGGSTLLTESVPAELRASAQGLSDFIMGVAGATAGALSGVIVAAWSFPALAFIAGGIAVLSLSALALTSDLKPVTS
jgi:MFS family permease